MMGESCGWSFLLALPDDIFAIVAQSLSPRDVCNLCLCCRSLSALATNDKVWFTQCEMLRVVPVRDLVEWRKGVLSYRVLCKFLESVKSLIGIWVHQNPELGNVVYVMPGFISIVGCRIIPQELGPLGIKEGPILWAPVFEILGDIDGSSLFFLHGRDKDDDYLYPGSVKAVDKACNMLLLEVVPKEQISGEKFADDKELLARIDPLRSLNLKSQRVFGQNKQKVQFNRLAFGDRRKLLETVTSQVRLKVPDLASGLLFPRMSSDYKNFQQDFMHLRERRYLLMQMHKLRNNCSKYNGNSQPPADPTQLEISEMKKALEISTGLRTSLGEDDCLTQSTKRKNIAGYFKDGLKQILGKSTLTIYGRERLRSSTSRSDSKHAQLQEFLYSGDTIGLALNASNGKLSSYRAWPNMHDSRFALYKLPMQEPKPSQEYGGLWGGTFGWPPGMPSEDKPGKALYFLFLSYEESQDQRLLIATKILEGTHYVLHPNGSAMFIVNLDEPSSETFPWDSDGDSEPLNITCAYTGEGIANGYGFRYPGSKPGSLFVIQGGLLAFIWKESRTVLTMQRLNLQELLKKGERVPALPPTANFAYLTKSYSNVFAGFSSTSNGLALQR
ncbi:F-box protein At5g39450-like [Apium graveolens]|uniref:F-box protein At5g39450-like n=1 Tax=Apium graveolens TaxID=4045 RepID=UPI003D7A262F